MKNRSSLQIGLLGLGASLILGAPGIFAQDTAAPTDQDTVVPPPRFRANVQGNRTQPPGGDRGQQLAATLNLTADQKTKFDAEMKDFQDKMKALQDAHDKKLAEFLSADQVTKLHAMQLNRGPGGFGGPGFPGGGFGRGGGFGPDPQQMLQSMKAELNLTADQESQISKILEASQTKMEAMRRSADTANGDPRALFTQMRAINQDRMSKINAVLTEEQRAKFQAMQPQRGPGFGPGGPGFGPGGPGGPGFGPGGPGGPGGPPPGGPEDDL
jgi:Spy/CpxP family protein refolding chaperone